MALRNLVVLFCLFAFPAISQPIYQVNEVEKAAEPAGGLAMFNRFVLANLRIPIQSAARGMNARVLIKGVVETDGTMSGLAIARPLDSLCDAEALRVMNLYKAWKPASLKNQPVRQAVVYPIQFRTAPIPAYDSARHAMIEYFDKNYQMVSDEKKFRYRNIIPVDRYGDVRADILFQEKRSGDWKTVKAFPFVKNEIWVQLSGPVKLDSIKAYRISANMGNWESPSEEITVQPDGRLLSFVAYPGSGKLPAVRKSYYQSGMLKEERIAADSLVQVTSWYDNGQLGSVILIDNKNRISVKENRDTDGNVLVKEGNGMARIHAGTYRGKTVYEEGMVENGFKTGRWTGKLAVSDLVYEEFYEGGKLTKGVRHTGEQPLEYTVDIVQPKFRAGPKEFFKLLRDHVNYMPPMNPSIGRPEGKLLISFLVSEEGRLSDFSIDRGVAKHIDQQVLEVIKMTDGLWDPCIQKGLKISSRHTFPINFETN
ncbi:hypothetical protein FEM33_16540 [Dyadobacter flavalbus]|uniref:TonB C-terminal domain-containing protein n=1 Tax=Dyadobacter flavalbus TaxID=2579942 RepID=A0A5M8QQ58_9BACT|nr:hypothetical protein FEM33_16540 [Dyadobacter flavalbus]